MIYKRRNNAKKLRKNLKIPEDKIKYAPHHFSHALSAITFADKDIAQKPMLHFVFDGVGDDNCQSIISTESTDASIIFEEKFPNSLGLFYSTITDFCGFLVNLAPNLRPKTLQKSTQNRSKIDGKINAKK